MFLVTTKNAFVPVDSVNNVNSEFQLSHKGVSEVSEQARGQGEQAKQAKRV